MGKKIQSTRFGELEIKEEDTLFFPYGLPGFPDETNFVYLPYSKESPFAFLQSLKDPDLAFTVVNPFIFLNDYSFNLEDQILSEMDILESEPPQVMNIVRIPENAEEMTANLVAPLIINWRNRKARQVLLENSPYSVRQRLFPNGFLKEDKAGEENS